MLALPFYIIFCRHGAQDGHRIWQRHHWCAVLFNNAVINKNLVAQFLFILLLRSSLTNITDQHKPAAVDHHLCIQWPFRCQFHSIPKNIIQYKNIRISLDFQNITGWPNLTNIPHVISIRVTGVDGYYTFPAKMEILLLANPQRTKALIKKMTS